MLKKFLPIIILVIVVVGAGSFYGGMVYGKSSSKGSLARDFNPEQFGANITGMGQRGGRVNGTGTVGAGGGFVSGEVMNQDEQSITLKLQDAGTKIIFFSPLKFLYIYILKLGFLDGVHGFMMAAILSFHSYLSWSKQWLNQRKA